jgi:hypothetical protein
VKVREAGVCVGVWLGWNADLWPGLGNDNAWNAGEIECLNGQQRKEAEVRKEGLWCRW